LCPRKIHACNVYARTHTHTHTHTHSPTTWADRW
jgi:hypothetical protein